MKDCIVPLHKVSHADRALVGGKAASLGDLIQAKLPVPPGFVVTTKAFTRYQDKQLPREVQNNILKAFGALGTECVAVRSSAVAEDSSSASWAGQLESYLNVTKDNLIEAITHCWQSIHSERAIAYAKDKKLSKEKLAVAVIVQQMVASEKSGVLFTVNPVTNNHDELMIEAAHGLGELLVQGEITPDNYLLNKNSRKLISQTLGSQKLLLTYRNGQNQKMSVPKQLQGKSILNRKHLQELTKLGKQIENHYNKPQDIEWTIAKEKIFIVQSRPITTIVRSLSQKIVDRLKNDITQIDWSGPASLLHISLAKNGHFSQMHKLFGVKLPYVYVDYRKGVASGYTPVSVNEELGRHFVKLLHNSSALGHWCQEFRKSGELALKAIDVSPKEYLKNLDQIITAYDIFASYHIATKIAYTAFSPQADQEMMKQLETARKQFETFFKSASAKANEVCRFLRTAFPEYTLDQLQCLTVNEIYLAQKRSKKIPPPDELQKRFERMGIYLTENDIVFFDGKDADKIQKQWTKEHTSKLLYGRTAYPGAVKGFCRVVVNFNGANIRRGEILVTGMTDPNFISLLKKAAAIVTDGGGMLSHAAIIARELKKPCVVGTKIATRVLKDGDEVEVDADKGTVGILESTS